MRKDIRVVIGANFGDEGKGLMTDYFCSHFPKNEKVLNVRAFTANQKREAYERQKGICPICGEHFDFDEMEGDHIIPWSKGGKTISDNCQMLCRNCNRKKQNI